MWDPLALAEGSQEPSSEIVDTELKQMLNMLDSREDGEDSEGHSLEVTNAEIQLNLGPQAFVEIKGLEKMHYHNS